MFKSEVKGTGWAIIKILLAIATFSLFIYQMIFAGQWIVNNQHEGRRISSADYESLVTGETVWGKLEKIDANLGFTADGMGTSLTLYAVKTESGKLLIFRTEEGSKCDKAMSKVMSGKSKEMYFIGYVKSLRQVDSSNISLNMISNNMLDEFGINNEKDINDVIIGQAVDVSIYEKYSDEKVFIASIVGGLFMLVLTFLLLRKIIKNAIYSIGVAKGKIEPEIPEITDPILEELRERDAIKSTGINMIDYYKGYERDSIDFTQEKEHRTIYGEEYQIPTLEKDIATYESYEYDSMDFAQDKVDEKDINQF